MNTRQDVAAALGVTDKRLCYLLYSRKERGRYRDFGIPKRSGGTRTISSPPTNLLWLQRQAYDLLKKLYDPKPCVHGFTQKRSIVSNSRIHIASRFVINFDLSNFFPTIHIGRVIGVLRRHPFSFGIEAATVIAQICCREDGVLPQGGAMSPMISNLVCRGLDSDLIAFAQKHKLRYSRYADDLTFSTTRPAIPAELLDTSSRPVVPGNAILSLVEKHSFLVHATKIKHRSRSRRQEVTGLTVNSFPNVTRGFVRAIDGALHAWERHGHDAAQRLYESRCHNHGGQLLRNVLRGRIAFLKMVRGEHDFIYRRLSRRFNRLVDDTAQVKLLSIDLASPCRLHNRTSSWNTWISKYEREVFHLLTTNESGADMGGTAFHIGSGVVATARHNVFALNDEMRPNVTLRVKDKEPVDVLSTKDESVAKPDVCCLRCQNIEQSRGIPTQLRLPEIGEEVAAIGFPSIPRRLPTLVMHVGTIEALPVCYQTKQRFIQVSFQSGGGLSGGCLIDRSGHALGVMVENVFMAASGDSAEIVPQRPYGQAVPIEYVDNYLHGVV
jgi:RNA-directed DNA polymerase